MENRPLPYRIYQENSSSPFEQATKDPFDQILNHMSQGLIFIDAQGRIMTYNPSAEALLGIPKSKALLHQFSDVFDDCLFGFSLSEALHSSCAPKNAFVTLQTNCDEEVCEMEIETSFVLKEEKDGPISHLGLIILLRDITEIKRLQMISHRSDRMKELGEMAAMVAHEIHNPLAGIKGFASLLVQDLQEYSKLKEMAEHIISATKHLDALVTNILHYAAPLKLELVSTDLSSLLDEVVQYIKVDSSLKQNISIDCITPESPLYAKIDSELMKSAILNLLMNAVQAMPEEGGKIDIHLKSSKRETIINIKDSGIGISIRDQKNLFKPFFTTKSGGHGLGLAEVNRIIHEHHGEISVESKEGKGSLFTIKIPKN